MPRAESGLAATVRAHRAGGPQPAGGRPGRRALAWAAAAFGVALGAYVAVVATHRIKLTLGWFDLNIYNHAGLIVRHAPNTLYTWHFLPGVQYLYTPFAALGFAAGSLLPWAVLKWLMTVASLAAMVFTVWVTFGQLGWRGQDRAAAVLGVSAVALWTEPVLRSVQVGQIELVLMALIVWDMCQSDDRKWKGAGVGLAAGIKLVPLIFIPYLLLAGKRQQAAIASAAFVGTVLIGFAALPYDSVKWWLTGYFLHAGDFLNTSQGALLNQSLLALVTRTPAGAGSVTALWLLLAVVIGWAGLVAAVPPGQRGRDHQAGEQGQPAQDEQVPADQLQALQMEDLGQRVPTGNGEPHQAARNEGQRAGHMPRPVPEQGRQRRGEAQVTDPGGPGGAHGGVREQDQHRNDPHPVVVPADR